jgi:hypothetical protein
MRKADSLQDFAISAEKQMLAQAMKPPQNNHDAWQTWGGAASLLALVGDIAGGRHFTAALGAAGAMMQSAESADRGAYDKAYAQWKDQRDFGMRATELLVREANQAVSRAGANYNHQMAALQSLSSAYQLPKTLDHQMLADIQQRMAIEKQMAEIHKAQNTESETRLAIDEKDSTWSQQNGGQPVPAGVHNMHVGEVKREAAGTTGAFQILTDPTTNQQYRYNPTTGAATTLDMQPYTPGGAQRVGTGSQAPPQPQTVDYAARAIAGYQLAPVSGYAMRTPYGQQVMGKVFELNPDYDQSKWQAKVRGEVAFTAGKEGAGIRSFSVAIDHLNTMKEAGEALAGHDFQRLNRLQNEIAAELGYEGPVDFAFVKSIVGSEVSKAIIGGIGALADREELRVTDFAAASGVSPYPASRSIDTGTDTPAVIRATKPVTISNGTSSPSAYPSADATAALLVATAGEVFPMALAVATSQALNRMSGSPVL